MKKIMLPLAILALSSCAFAQNKKGFYIKGGISYFLKVAPVEFPNVGPLQPRITQSYIDGTTGKEVVTHDETITGSFGEGFRAEIVPGYRFNKYIALEIGLHYFTSAKQEMTHKTVYAPDKTTPLVDINANGDVQAFDVAPNAVFNLPLEGNWQPYARVGVIVPVHGRLKIKTDILDKPGSTVDPSGTVANIQLHREEVIKPRPTVGFQYALGTNYFFSKENKWGIYIEVEYRNVSVSSKTKTVEVYNGTGVVKANGQPVTLSIDQLTTAQKETVYEKSINPSAPQDPNQPSKDLRSYINIGGLGFTAGVRYNF